MTTLTYEWKKPEVNKKERAEFINDYIVAHNISIREFGRLFDIHHNTVQDWLLWNHVTEDQIKEYKDEGHTDTDIYRLLRNNKGKLKPECDERIIVDLRIAKNRLRKCLRYNKKNFEAYKETKDIINICNKLIMRLD